MMHKRRITFRPESQVSDGKPSQDLIDEYTRLYPGVSESIRCRFSATHLQAEIDKAKAGADPPKAKSTKPKSSRFHELGLFWKRGTVEGKLELSEIAVWLRLWEVEGREGPDYASISYRQVEKDTRLSVRGVRLALAALQKKLMLKTVRKGNIKGDVNHYVISPYPSQKILDDKDADYGRHKHVSTVLSTAPPTVLSSKPYGTEYRIPEGGDKSPLPGRRSVPASGVPDGTGSSSGTPDRADDEFGRGDHSL